MAAQRGRPSKAAQEELLKQGGSAIVDDLNRRPLRQPIDPAFKPFYERVLNGDLAAILDFCKFHCVTLDESSSFCELVGRLVLLQPVRSARLLVVEIARGRGVSDALEANAYNYWYSKLKLLSQIARDLIQDAYEADPSVKRENLWHRYVDTCYVERRQEKQAVQKLNEWKQLAETESSHAGESSLLCDLIDKLSTHFLIPKSIFFELAESSRSACEHADRRFHIRRFLHTPSFIARKYAAQMVGISPRTASNRNRRK